MFSLFSKDKKLSNDINISEIVGCTDGFTGAQIQEMLVFATLDCLHKNKTIIDQEHLKKAAQKVRYNYKINGKMVV